MLARLLQPRALITDVKFQTIVEAEPNRDSRVTLVDDRRDRLGMNRVKVDWQLTELVKRTFDRTFALLAQEMQHGGRRGRRRSMRRSKAGRGPRSWKGTWHHMGTTRMHDSPKCRRGGSRLQGAWHEQSVRCGQFGVSDRGRQFPDHHDRRDDACVSPSILRIR